MGGIPYLSAYTAINSSSGPVRKPTITFTYPSLSINLSGSGASRYYSYYMSSENTKGFDTTNGLHIYASENSVNVFVRGEYQYSLCPRLIPSSGTTYMFNVSEGTQITLPDSTYIYSDTVSPIRIEFYTIPNGYRTSNTVYPYGLLKIRAIVSSSGVSQMYVAENGMVSASSSSSSTTFLKILLDTVNLVKD